MPISPSEVAPPNAGIDPSTVGAPAPAGGPSDVSKLESEGGKVLNEAESVAKRYDPIDYGRLQDISGVMQHEEKAISADFKGAQRDPNILHAAGDLYGGIPWHVMNLLGSPAGVAIQQGATDPLDHAITTVANKISGAFPKGPANQPGWTVHSGDVKQAGQITAQFANAYVNAESMMLGGEEAAGHMPEDAPKEAPEEIGGAKPRVRITGTTPEGKPRIRVVTPEEAASNVSAAVRQVTHNLEPETDPAGYEAVDQVFKGMDRKVGDQIREWGKPPPTPGYPTNAPKTVGEVIDKTLLPNADFAVRGLLKSLRQYAGDTPIYFTHHILEVTKDGFAPKASVLGQYHWSPDDPHNPGHILIATGEHNTSLTRTIVHEAVHAATSRFIDNNPDSPEVNQLRSLYRRVREETLPFRKGAAEQGINLPKTASGSRRVFYGEHNLHEFTAEALSNPKFQRFLSRIKIAGKSAWHALSGILSNMFNVSPSNELMLHHVMKATTDIMQKQQEWDIAGHLQESKAAFRDEDPAVHPVTVQSIKEDVEKSPAVRRLAGYLDELQRLVSPESLGKYAKQGAVIASQRIAEFKHLTAAYRQDSASRFSFWEQNAGKATQFIRQLELGQKLSDPVLEGLRQKYQDWNNRIAERDNTHLGFEYIPRDNYLMHIFKDPEKVAAWMTEKYGKKWYNPAFIKDRTFNLYDEAVKEGFEPRYTNPEEIMLARQQASDRAAMQINVLEDMRRNGLAIRKLKGMKVKPGSPVAEWRAPNGDMYLVHKDAATILHNQFDVTPFSHRAGFVGDVARGYMNLKNAVVMGKLGFSLFHAVWTTGMDNFSASAYALSDALAGKRSIFSTAKELMKSGTLIYRPFFEDPKTGDRLVKIFNGQIPATELNETDTQQLQFMLEGGFVPRMPDEYRSQAVAKFQQAIREHSIKSVWRLPLATLQGMGYPMFEVWIPRLKAAAYMRGVDSLLRRDPTLLDDDMRRGMAFRKVAKSIDNRLGEMSYDTNFMHRHVRGLGVGLTLSLGRLLGFVREYGGAPIELGQWAKDGFTPQAIKEGNLDKAIFAASSLGMMLGYGGLMTYMMSGHKPDSLEDYMYPRVGGANPDGTPMRVSTPMYTKEIGSIMKHWQNEGALPAMTDFALSKSAGVLGMVGEWASGTNSYGDEFRDPNAPAYKQLEQTGRQMFKDLEPISFEAIRRSMNEGPKSIGLSLAGFNPAPKYATETPLEGHIATAYKAYIGHAVTPYDKAQESEDFRKLHALYSANDNRFYDQLNHMQDKYKLTDSQVFKLTDELQDNLPSSVRMFMRLPWQEQQRLLNQMNPAEQQEYLPHSNAAHLRYSYQPPESVQ